MLEVKLSTTSANIIWSTESGGSPSCTHMPMQSQSRVCTVVAVPMPFGRRCSKQGGWWEARCRSPVLVPEVEPVCQWSSGRTVGSKQAASLSLWVVVVCMTVAGALLGGASREGAVVGGHGRGGDAPCSQSNPERVRESIWDIGYGGRLMLARTARAGGAGGARYKKAAGLETVAVRRANSRTVEER
ncbi:hypothetical protein K461DRAFT_264736 [Myriangium duriaei CBS 260.36]|uniref:Uncharacterized protein n=1 Tax=Myriangium duriaei CBS 260.36 TaxID=1168546 RepID=A0A9P4JD33_9PEZI|nr:hypothetical protein K461DRAFT_264736 [Myriangium duriaei CBS 260.36]